MSACSEDANGEGGHAVLSFQATRAQSSSKPATGMPLPTPRTTPNQQLARSTSRGNCESGLGHDPLSLRPRRCDPGTPCVSPAPVERLLVSSPSSLRTSIRQASARSSWATRKESPSCACNLPGHGPGTLRRVRPPQAGPTTTPLPRNAARRRQAGRVARGAYSVFHRRRTADAGN